MKKIKILGASTLKDFSVAIGHGFLDIGWELSPDVADLELIQVHASPNSQYDDFKILQALESASEIPRLALLHRPDELILNLELLDLFLSLKWDGIIFLGDLCLEEVPWKWMELKKEVIPHPYTSLSSPQLIPGKYTVGTFTSWGEMRNLDHALLLLNELKAMGGMDKIMGLLGGKINGKNLHESDIEEAIDRLGLDLIFTDVLVSKNAFVPHFNVQLYHLNGKKRRGESSGSLHKGISVPVIIEANGIERVEGIRVIKLSADEELQALDYKSCAGDILELVNTDQVGKWLHENKEKALLNLPHHFASRVLAILGFTH